MPNEFYPEDSWHDDMEFGATEIALAQQGRDAKPFLADAATFARGYLDGETGDTFNLYDTSALAHADLIQALGAAGNPTGLVTPAALVSDLNGRSGRPPTGPATTSSTPGATPTDFDVNAHTFGLLTTEALYRQASGDSSYARFATEQRNWLLGATPGGPAS